MLVPSETRVINNHCSFPYEDILSVFGILSKILKLSFSIPVSVFPIQQKWIQSRDEAGGCGSWAPVNLLCSHSGWGKLPDSERGLRAALMQDHRRNSAETAAAGSALSSLTDRQKLYVIRQLLN